MPAREGMTDQGPSLSCRSREYGRPNDEGPRHLGRLFDESSRHLVECLPPRRSPPEDFCSIRGVLSAKAGTFRVRPEPTDVHD
jgi:hypothetical protein